MVVAMISPDRGIIDRAVQPFDLSIGTRMVGLGQKVVDPVRLTDQIIAHRGERHAVAVPGLSANRKRDP